MLYKEWRSVRLKFVLWLVAFIVIGTVHALAGGNLSLNNWLRNYNNGNFDHSFLTPADYFNSLKYATPLYQSWLDKFLLAIAVCAIIAGSDTISEEKDKQTINFLLSRPVTRSQIYNTKLLLNIIALWTAGIVGCAIVWLVDITGPKPLDFKLVVLSTGVVLITGAGIVFLTALISIYAQNFIQTLALTLITIIALYVGLLVVTHGRGFSFDNNVIDGTPDGNVLLNSLSLSVLFYDCVGFLVATVALYFTGFTLFSKKEF